MCSTTKLHRISHFLGPRLLKSRKRKRLQPALILPTKHVLLILLPGQLQLAQHASPSVHRKWVMKMENGKKQKMENGLF